MKISLLIALLIIFSLLGCAPGKLIKNSLNITQGQTKNEVQNILGSPENRQFRGKDEAWQYCETDYGGFSGDDYVIVWFYDGQVTGVTTYKNTQMGDCSKFFKTVRWEDAPDRTSEFRQR